MIRTILLTVKVSVLIFLVNNSVYSQQQQLLKESNQYKISYVAGVCDVASGLQPFEFRFIQIENLSNETITISFNIVTLFDEGCTGCNNEDESFFQTTLAPHQLLNTDCNTNNRLKVYVNNPNFSGAWHFRSLSIANVEVN